MPVEEPLPTHGRSTPSVDHRATAAGPSPRACHDGGMRSPAASVAPVLAVAILLGAGACSSSSTPGRLDAPAEPGTPPVTATTSPAPTPRRTDTRPGTQTPARTAPRPRERGVDVSHHQGPIDWSRVAGDGISFAYLKATEGSTFTDPALSANWAGARSAGLRVGGYHYYTLCAEPEPQAEHFVAALRSVGAGPRSLPPVVDLELIGNCDPPPARADLRAAVTTFIDRVEQATGRRVVVYVHPDFERTYDLVAELDRRLWVRRTGTRPPPGEWWLWQRSDTARVDGISTPVDLDVMR